MLFPRGTKLAQAVLEKVLKIPLEETQEKPENTWRTGGSGSTGFTC